MPIVLTWLKQTRRKKQGDASRHLNKLERPASRRFLQNGRRAPTAGRSLIKDFYGPNGRPTRGGFPHAGPKLPPGL